jgi:HAD superfamily hydrolase (TIGR01509 family)
LPEREDPMIKGVVFDFDGTLVDSMNIIFEVLNEALSKRNLPKISLELLGRMAGQPISDMVNAEMHVPETTIKAIEKDVFKSYMKFCRTSCQPLPHVENTLKILKSKGVKLGLLTTTPRKPLEVAVRKLAIGKYFDVMLAKNDAKNKPDPDGLKRIIREFGIRKDYCLYVGDSPTDILTGKAAGIKTIAITTGITTMEQLKENTPDNVITDMEQLLTLVN